jgi:hypothetical protein
MLSAKYESNFFPQNILVPGFLFTNYYFFFYQRWHLIPALTKLSGKGVGIKDLILNGLVLIKIK